MINFCNAKKYCKDDISLIENYDKAIADKTQVWHCHHRRETIFTPKDLMEIGEYYNRPACELIFLTKSEHNRLHKIGENNPHFGKPSAFKGKHHSSEALKKISEAKKGENHPMFGKQHSEESRKKMSESKKGSYFFNNGVICVRAKTCPEGFVPGRLKRT